MFLYLKRIVVCFVSIFYMNIFFYCLIVGLYYVNFLLLWKMYEGIINFFC